MMNRRALLQLILTAPGHRLVPLPPAPLTHRFGTVTMTFTPPPKPSRVLMMFLQDEIRAIRWPGNIQWVNGSPPAGDNVTIIPMHWIGDPL